MVLVREEESEDSFAGRLTRNEDFDARASAVASNVSVTCEMGSDVSKLNYPT